MKCLIINGSPSKSYKWGGKVTESFTGKLVDEVKNVMSRNVPVEFEEIRLMDINLPYCKGCLTAFIMVKTPARTALWFNRSSKR